METKTQDYSDLKEFLDPKNPILQKFRDTAPGTYKHCVNVSMLCESVALALDLDVDLMKTSAMYHDIGKINFPGAFSENQNGKNVHDELDPWISYQIITRHVADSVLILLNIEGMHKDVLKIVSQHHGDTVLRFFYEKAGKDVVDDIFRYKCQKPETIEAAVLMICDSVEATSRSLASNNNLETTDQRRSVVNTTVRRLVDDDQLDNMTVGQLKVLKRTLFKELENIYHKREPYPDDDTESSDVDDIE